MSNYDFCGWATRANIKCSDGRTIMRDAFKGNDGQTVPLVWNHRHDDVFDVLGHAVLENRDEGVYAYCKFNESESGRAARTAVNNGDLSSLSIYANKLKQNGGNVLHGEIREVSLVLAGANPGAKITDILRHSDEDPDEAIIHSGFEGLELYHAEDSKEEPKEEKKMAEETKKPETEGEETVQDVIDTMNEKQKNVMYALIGQALSGDDNNDEGDENMKHNVFDNNEEYQQDDVLTHSEIQEILADGKRYGSLKEAFLQHGIEDIDMLFPEAKSLNTPPEFVQRDQGWVAKVMNGVHHTPFSRIKSMFADLREDEARAKGYLPDVDENGKSYRDALGNKVDKQGKPAYKKEEVFGLMKRATTPTTIYKKQKLDRDDVIDITDFDVVAWLKGEMRMMLEEEIARAILIGDGRPSSSDERINPMNIRPIVDDDPFYCIQHPVTVAANATEEDVAKATIRGAVKARKNYKGSGSPTLFTTEDMLIDMMLLEDGIGHRLYKNESELASAMRVSNIVTVPVMESYKNTSGTNDLMGVIVNLSDYNVGADKGGAVNMFDDFDIDYNAQKYLIETRCSGALIKPYSAIALRKVTGQASE